LEGLIQLPAGLVSLLCQLIDPGLELLQYRRRLMRYRELGLRRFGSLVVGGRRAILGTRRHVRESVMARLLSHMSTPWGVNASSAELV
jgi:hypothetical protein